jgi:ATP-dependent Clp protease ATP-binding subunit ClpA
VRAVADAIRRNRAGIAAARQTIGFVQSATPSYADARELVMREEILEKLARDCFDPLFGARPLRRAMERQLENPLAMRIVRGQCPADSRVRVHRLRERVNSPSSPTCPLRR